MSPGSEGFRSSTYFQFIRRQGPLRDKGGVRPEISARQGIERRHEIRAGETQSGEITGRGFRERETSLYSTGPTSSGSPLSAAGVQPV